MSISVLNTDPSTDTPTPLVVPMLPLTSTLESIIPVSGLGIACVCEPDGTSPTLSPLTILTILAVADIVPKITEGGCTAGRLTEFVITSISSAAFSWSGSRSSFGFSSGSSSENSSRSARPRLGGCLVVIVTRYSGSDLPPNSTYSGYSIVRTRTTTKARNRKTRI